MSNLKHLNEEQLSEAKGDCEQYINNLRRKIGTLTGTMNGQETRLTWINKYLEDKSRQIINGHPIYNKHDAMMKTDDILAHNVVEGGLAICMNCGSAEAELDTPCVGKPKSIDEIGEELLADAIQCYQLSINGGGCVIESAEALVHSRKPQVATLTIPSKLGVTIESALQNGRDLIEGSLNSVKSPSHHTHALREIYQDQMDECDEAIAGLHELFPVLFRVEK